MAASFLPWLSLHGFVSKDEHVSLSLFSVWGASLQHATALSLFLSHSNTGRPDSAHSHVDHSCIDFESVQRPTCYSIVTRAWQAPQKTNKYAFQIVQNQISCELPHIIPGCNRWKPECCVDRRQRGASQMCHNEHHRGNDHRRQCWALAKPRRLQSGHQQKDALTTSVFICCAWNFAFNVAGLSGPSAVTSDQRLLACMWHFLSIQLF